MHKMSLIVLATALSILGLSVNASAHGDGTYPMRRPIVASSSAVIGPDESFAVGAGRFCPNESITITLTKGSKQYTKTTTTNAKGRAVVWFKSSDIKPGLYKIKAAQGPPCNKSAISFIRIKGKKSDSGSGSGSGSCVATVDTTNTGSCSGGTHSLGSSYPGSGVVAAFTDLQLGMDARAAGAADAVLPFAGTPQDIVETPGGHELSPFQLTGAALLAGIGLLGVEIVRRRARRPLVTATATP